MSHRLRSGTGGREPRPHRAHAQEEEAEKGNLPQPPRSGRGHHGGRAPRVAGRHPAHAAYLRKLLGSAGYARACAGGLGVT